MARQGRHERPAAGLLLALLALRQEVAVASAAAGDRPAGPDPQGAPRQALPVNSSAGRVDPKAQEVWHGGAPLRALAPLLPNTGWQWPAGTLLRLQYVLGVGMSMVDVSTESATQIVVVASGCRETADGGAPVRYNRLRIWSIGTEYGTAHQNAVVKLVSTSDRYKCYTNDYVVPVGIASRDGPVMGDLGVGSGPLPLTKSSSGAPANVDDTLSAMAKKIVFMWGGTYNLCYAPDGTFDLGTQSQENVLPVSIKVLGVKSPCAGRDGSPSKGDGCIDTERWDCFFSYQGDGSVTNCIFNFKDDGARPGWSVTAGDRSKLTWSDPYGPDSPLTPDGLLASPASMHAEYCGVGKPNTEPILDQSTLGDILVADASTFATLPGVRTNHSTAFSLAACYCPSYDIETGQPCVGNAGALSDICCEKHTEFIQMVGVIYFWTIRICDMGNYDGVRALGSQAGCAAPYRRVLPQQKFVLRIECPPGAGCSGDGNNLVKYIDTGIDNDMASWKDNHPCKVNSEPASVVWPTASASQSLSGGTRVDYKVWWQQPVKINKSVKQQLDVCFSNTNSPTYFFKVGTIKTASAFAFASEFPGHRDPDNIVNRSTVRYAGYNGSLTLYGGVSGPDPNPYDSNPYSGKALAYLMSYDRETLWGQGSSQKTLEEFLGFQRTMPSDFQAQLDTQCQRYRPSTFLISPNPLPLAQVAGATTANSRYQTFSGATQNQYVKVNLAGVIAVCYCAMVADNNQCENPAHWIFAGRMTIQGPMGNQQWDFDIGVVVKLSVLGWGLSGDDRLRIIPNSNQCTDRSGDPLGDVSFKTGCPSTIGTTCSPAMANTDITLTALTGPGASNSVTIMQIQVYNDYSQLQFTNSTQGLLVPGDVITIDYASITTNLKSKDEETPWEKYETSRLSGEYDFQDTTGPDDVLSKYMVGHRVSAVDNSGVVDPNKLAIPIGWPSPGRPSFTFPASGGQPGGRWTRRNKVETAEEIRGTSATPPSADLKVCWGVLAGGSASFYQQAGFMSFKVPPTMSQAKVFLTTIVVGAIAPVVIFFKTDPLHTQFSTVTGKTKLMLRFLDIRGEDGKLIPYFAQDNPPSCLDSIACPEEPLGAEEVTYANARQYLCGKLFSELWSEDTEGFPVPHGCYYSKRYKDAADPSAGLLTNDNPFYKEITIVFNERNGLRANTKYMIVMNAKGPTALLPSAARVPVVDLFAMCAEEAGCDRPYMVFEKSTAEANMPVLAGTYNDPRLTSTGFEIQAPNQAPDDEGVLSLSEMNILQVRLTAGNGQRAVRAQAILRVYLWPLTQWNIGEAPCTALCRPYHATTAARCSGTVGCKPLAVVDAGLYSAYNVIKLTLPSDMTDITETTQHTIRVLSLTLPRGGFFPTRVGVQLTRDDDSAPQYSTSSGLIWKQPEAGRTEGRLVLTDRTGYGPKPFAGDRNNKLLVRIQFGATLWNWGDSRLAAMLEIHLPPDYSCSVVGGGEPLPTLGVFQADSDSDNYPDNNRGILSVNPMDGGWSRSMERSCYYELYKYNRIYEKQVIYVELNVMNPANPLQKSDPKNLWEIQISSKGANSASTTDGGVSMRDEPFTNNSQIQYARGGTTYFSGNAAVIKALNGPLFQPAASPNSFTRSCCGPSFDQRRTQQYLRAFFKPGVPVGQRGYVIIDAPDGFDFGNPCNVGDLSPAYYAFTGINELRLKPLKPPLVCEGSRYPASASTYDRARIRVTGLIDTVDREYYGFQVLVTHPSTYTTDQQEQWRLWTEDSMGYGLEGSQDTVMFNPTQASAQTRFYHKSWGLYAEPTSAVKIYIATMKPFTITGNADAAVTFYPFQFPVATQTSLRITAPVGFVWNTDAKNFQPTANCTADAPCEDFGGSGLVPQVESTVENALVWTSVYFNPQVNYGFQYKIRIPSYNPRTSANSFFIEFGYEKTDITERVKASVIEAPRVAALINCKVGYNSNQEGVTDTRMQFELETVSTISLNAGIVITGDQNTKGFTFAQEYALLPDSDPLPGDLVLLVAKEADNTPRIQFKVLANPIPPGLYKFEMKASNPTARILTAGQWTFGSYTDVSQYPTKYYLDNEMTTPGFVINRRMQYAGLYQLTAAQKVATDREDRPGYMNSLVFEFELKSRPQVQSDLLIKGPRGFVFEDDCLGPPTDPTLKTAQSTVFGPNTGGVWPSGSLAAWAPVFAPLGCKGDGRDALITIPVGLQTLSRYAFRIRVQNPLKSPDWNKWTINYNAESSDPFPGFNIWTCVGTPTVVAVSYARNQGGSADPLVNPVMLTFKPYKTIPGKPNDALKGGVLRVEVPAGFLFVQHNLACEVDFRVTGSATPLPASQMQCEIDSSFTKLNLYMMGAMSIIGEESGNGKEYQLIVYVYNPNGPQSPGDWHLNSFSKYTREPEYSLDESTIAGFAIHNDLWRFTVSNVLQEINGNRAVNEVEIVLNMRDPVKDGDTLTLFSPRGFNIVSNPEINQCNNYRPVGASPDWFPITGVPQCRCDDVANGPACRLSWAGFNEGKDPAFPQKQDIRFKIATQNPPKTPFITYNFWRAEHYSGTGGALLASAIAPSWSINPQLAKVKVQFASGYRSAGSQADLDFTFTPVNDACCVEIQAEFPTEFDFTQATVFTNYDILQQEGSRIVINLRLPGLIADKESSVRVYNVRLGRGGGQTRFSLITYSDDKLTLKKDESLQFTSGFRLPGKITVLGVPELTSAWKESRLMYPVKSLFQPRVGEWAKAEFRLSFSQPVMAQGKLIITCQGAGSSKGYTLRTESFVIIGTGQIDSIPVLDPVSKALQATLKANRPATEVALQADTPYTVSLRVYPDSDGTNTWRFDTTDSVEGFTNTNDGDAAGFSPVQNFLLTVTVQRSPPRAIIEVTLDVDQGTAVVRELLIIAPPGFTFNEGPQGCGDMCTPGQALGSTSRRTATLASPTGQPLTKLRGLVIQVLTPEQTPIGSGSEGIMWFVEGRGQGAGTTKGWGQGAGFAVTQMGGSAVYYAGVSNLRATQIAFMFTLDVNAGSSISVVAPAGFLLTCSMEGALRTLSLPGGKPSCIDDPLQLQLQQPLTAGTYSFVVALDLPAFTPEVNTFNIIIQDRYNNVVDAAYQISGETILDMGVESPTIAWSRAEPGQPAMITIGITFTRDTTSIKALLITLPELFQHDVQLPIDVQNLNSRFPLAAGLDWSDTSEPDRIKMFLDDQEDTTHIPADTYRWSFPVLVPPDVPRINLWFLSFCNDRACKQPDDRQVIVSFPLAGFKLFEAAPAALRISASTAKRRSRLGPGVTIVWPLLLLGPLLVLSSWDRCP